MLKQFLATTAVGTMLALGPALAQTATETPAEQDGDAAGRAPAQESASPETGAGFFEARPENEILVEDLLGARVVNTAGESLGDISNIVIVRAAATDGAGVTSGDQSAAGDDAMKEPEADAPDTAAAPSDEKSEQAAGANEDGTSEDGAGEDATRQQAQAEATVDRDQMASGTGGATTPEYRVAAVVIGVGGFLGIGEKQVAVPVERLEFQTMPNDEEVIVLNASKEQVEAAPAWRSAKEIAEEQEQAREQEAARQRMNSAGTGAPAAPAPASPD